MRKLDSVLDPLLDFHLQLITERQEMAWAKGLKERAPHIWLRDHATLRVDPGRQTGKSLYAARTADDLDIIVCKDSFHLKLMKKRRDIFRMPGTSTRVLSVTQALEFIEPIQDVWILDASLVMKDRAEQLYETMAHRCRRFILIG